MVGFTVSVSVSDLVSEREREREIDLVAGIYKCCSRRVLLTVPGHISY